MGWIKDGYEILTDLWDRLRARQRIPRERLAGYLLDMSKLLSTAQHEFAEKRIPRTESHNLAVLVNYAGRLSSEFGKEYPELTSVFDEYLPRVGELMDRADVFLRETDGYKSYFDVGQPPLYEHLEKAALRAACEEMQRTAGKLQAMAKVLSGEPQ